MSSSLTAAETQGKPKELLNQVRDVMRFKHHGLCKPPWAIGIDRNKTAPLK
jgi:hypothetical protein